MAQRNDLRRAFGGHDPRDARDGEDVPLFLGGVVDGDERVGGGEGEGAGGEGGAGGGGFSGCGDYVGFALGG